LVQHFAIHNIATKTGSELVCAEQLAVRSWRSTARLLEKTLQQVYQ
jgi:hypothetical protein